ncbi:MAG: peptidase S41, partial [Saprospiraceae bacterium]
MKIFKILFCSLYLCLSGNFNLQAQSYFNLNLEVLHDDQKRPLDWYGSFNKPVTEHHALLDKTVQKEGKYAIKIVAPKTKAATDGFGSSFTIIPAKYDGKNITLRGYVKTEKVNSGFAGLWMRQDGEAGMLEFDNMNDRGIKGDQGWTLCEVTLPLNPQTKKINIGGLLVGDGTMWFDDLSLTIDGQPLNQAPAKIEKIYGADADKEFDAGSKVTIESVQATQVQELARLGKIWGFLKYHHPNIATGNHNWDYELFRVLPAVLKAKDKKSRSKIYLDWIEKLGPISNGTTCTGPDKNVLAYQANFDWLKDNQFFSDA